jgi:predicted kinase
VVALIMLCGLPGSGKTTLAKAIEEEMPAVRLCPDEWMTALEVGLFDEGFRTRLEVEFRRHALRLVRMGVDVVLENGFWSRAERAEYRQAARAAGVPVHLRYLDVPFEELVRRLEVRNGSPGTVTITRALLTSYATLFEAPTKAELALFDRSGFA